METAGIVGIRSVCIGVAEADDPSFTLLAATGVVVVTDIGLVLLITLVAMCCIGAWPITGVIVAGICPLDFFGAAKSTGRS